MIQNDGTITWLTYAMLKTLCKLDIADFPVDNQNCTLKVGSWTLTSKELDLKLADDTQPSLDHYSDNTEWHLVSASATINVKKYPCCSGTYTDITYTLHFKRKPWFYIITIVLPCVILSLLASMSFLFPAGSGERVSLIISVLLGLTVFMLIINEEIPVSSDSTPMLTRYFSAICCGTFVSLLATALVLQIHHGSNAKPVSVFLAKMRNLIAFFVCVRAKSSSEKTVKKPSLLKSTPLNDEQRLSWAGTTALDSGITKRRCLTDATLMSNLNSHTVSRVDGKFGEEFERDWQRTAGIFDRFFFVISLSYFVGLNLYIIVFLNSWHCYDIIVAQARVKGGVGWKSFLPQLCREHYLH